MSLLVYYSTKSGNTHRFVEQVGLPAVRIPIAKTDTPLRVDEDYVLIVPTYGGGSEKGAIPPAVGRFLNDRHNRSRIRGVIACGNRNFGSAYCLAGTIISKRLNIPHLYSFEVFGTPEDVERVRTGVQQFWTRSLPPNP